MTALLHHYGLVDQALTAATTAMSQPKGRVGSAMGPKLLR
ncbi:hypothetical protein ABIA32_002362 [Streptacidiphilus sp. MAP12-20]